MVGRDKEWNGSVAGRSGGDFQESQRENWKGFILTHEKNFLRKE
jgi:hypothetical protein